jgi:hypothetical protein
MKPFDSAFLDRLVRSLDLAVGDRSTVLATIFTQNLATRAASPMHLKHILRQT